MPTGIAAGSVKPKETPLNIDNFVIAMRRDREAAHRARAAAGKAPRTAQQAPRLAPAPAVVSTER